MDTTSAGGCGVALWLLPSPLLPALQTGTEPPLTLSMDCRHLSGREPWSPVQPRAPHALPGSQLGTRFLMASWGRYGAPTKSQPLDGAGGAWGPGGLGLDHLRLGC